MSYTPTVWSNGDVITAEKLNNLEGGFEQSKEIFVISFEIDTDNSTINTETTFSEVLTAYQEKLLIIGNISDPAGNVPFTSFILTPGFADDEIELFMGKRTDGYLHEDAEEQFSGIRIIDFQLEFYDSGTTLEVATVFLDDQGFDNYSREIYTSEVQ